MQNLELLYFINKKGTKHVVNAISWTISCLNILFFLLLFIPIFHSSTDRIYLVFGTFFYQLWRFTMSQLYKNNIKGKELDYMVWSCQRVGIYSIGWPGG